MSKDGGPAFPMPAFDNRAENPADQIWHHAQSGMTLRDWFAGQALAGMCANPNANRVLGMAAEAYKAADAMITERDKK